nr:hypothetical protein PanWU01x14_319360 [Ipomoea batatas]
MLLAAVNEDKLTVRQTKQTAALVNDAGEIDGEIGIHSNDFGDIPVDLSNQIHVPGDVIRKLRLVVLVDLLNQIPVLIQHRLDISETLAQRLPRLLITLLAAAFLSLFLFTLVLLPPATETASSSDAPFRLLLYGS